jgi:hypothetical protein
LEASLSFPPILQKLCRFLAWLGFEPFLGYRALFFAFKPFFQAFSILCLRFLSFFFKGFLFFEPFLQAFPFFRGFRSFASSLFLPFLSFSLLQILIGW